MLETVTATESYKGLSQTLAKPAFFSRSIQPRPAKLVERFSELYNNDRLKTVKALKEMPDKSVAERMIYFTVEASIFEMLVAKCTSRDNKSYYVISNCFYYTPWGIQAIDPIFCWYDGVTKLLEMLGIHEGITCKFCYEPNAVMTSQGSRW